MKDLLLTNIAQVGALVMFLVTIFEFVFLKKASHWFRRFIVLAASFLISLGLFVSIYFFWAPKTQLELWKEASLSNFHACVDEKDKTNEIGMNCLSTTLQAHPLPKSEVRTDVADHSRARLEYRERTIEQLRKSKAMELLFEDQKIADLFVNSLGTYSNLFLGTGLTAPINNPSDRQNGIREYLLPNYCVSSTSSSCPVGHKHHINSWVWKMDQKYRSNNRGYLDRPIRASLLTTAPTFSGNVSAANFGLAYNMFEEYAQGGKTDNLQVLIRFSRFDEKNYRDTLGLPTRNMVFFSDLREVWDLTLRDAYDLSATIKPPIGPNVTDFIWVVVVDPSDGSSIPATWNEIYNYIYTYNNL